MQGDNIAPEVAAAQRERGLLGVSTTAVTGLSLDHLVQRMTSASNITIVGVLPRALAEALLDAEAAPSTDGSASRRVLRYLTPSAERMSTYRQSDILGRFIQRWHAGLVGFRNWASRAESRGAGIDSSVWMMDDIFLDCLIACESSIGQWSIFTAIALPQPGSILSTSRAPFESLILGVAEGPSVAAAMSRIHQLKEEAAPLVERDLICVSPTVVRREEASSVAADTPAEFNAQLVGIKPYRSPRESGSVIPVAVVAVCAESRHGPGVLLKYRTRFNAHNDFDCLSLLSERVMEEHLSLCVGKPVPQLVNEDMRLDYWWFALGMPALFDVPESAFIAAAQREVYWSCGLDLPPDRFERRGRLLVDRHEGPELLGFYAFRVALKRERGFAEFEHALAWNPDLRFVPVADLYQPAAANLLPGGSGATLLNRLLSLRQDWVRTVLLPAAADRRRSR
jgi:hypothetical protein